MVCANADITKADQAGEVIAFADYWSRVSGTDPGLLVFDSKVTTYKFDGELASRGISFLTLRQRGPKVLEALAALPTSEWTTYNLKRVGRYRRPQIHEEIIRLKDVGLPLRQIAIRNIGHENPTLLITNDLATAAKDLFGRYAERMIIENEFDADISGLQLNALASGLPLNVDLDTTLTVPASYPATSKPTPTGSGATSSTTPAPSPSPWPTTTSASTFPSAPTRPCSSTPATPNSTSHPLVARPDSPIRIPASVNLNPTIRTRAPEDRG